MLFGPVAHTPAPAQEIPIELVRRMSYENNDHRVLLRRIKGTTALFFQSKMSCDVDGSPNAYHPLDDSLSLDLIDSAGGRRRGGLLAGPLEVQPAPEVVVYVNGKPYVQEDGPYKGFYVSETSYENKALDPKNPARYLDARSFRYVVLPGGMVPEAHLGDVVVVYDPYSERTTYAVYGDIGPSSESGEVSLGTIKGLGLPASDGKSSPGQARDDLFYLVFPGSSAILEQDTEWPHSQATIDKIADEEFEKWGGVDRIKAVLQQDPQAGSIKDDPALFDELAWWRWCLPAGYEFSLPLRYSPSSSIAAEPRRPCEPELVVGIDAALRACQSRIALKEQGQAVDIPAGTQDHLHSLIQILKQHPIACSDEGVSIVRRGMMAEALCARLDKLGI